jgi:alpha-D-ribose 1-methylphosphonate 5-triphosphate synthase subunit PhnG
LYSCINKWTTAQDVEFDDRRARPAGMCRRLRRGARGCRPWPRRQGGLLALWSDWLCGARRPAHEILRPPEIGTVMVRGRAGATGAAFNLGEMTVTRATVRLTDGAVGHGHIQGRDKDAALAAALIDALCEAGEAEALEPAISRPPARGGRGHAAGPARPGRRRRRWSSSPWSGEKTHECSISKAGSPIRPGTPPTPFAARFRR